MPDSRFSRQTALRSMISVISRPNARIVTVKGAEARMRAVKRRHAAGDHVQDEWEVEAMNP